MHNRARLLTASFLTKDLYIDWRLGAAHFAGAARRRRRREQHRQLAVGRRARASTRARTASSTRSTQAKRFDPDGVYVRRYVPGAGRHRGRCRARAVEARRAARGLSARRSSITARPWRGCRRSARTRGAMTFRRSRPAAPASEGSCRLALLRAARRRDLARAARLSPAHFSREFRRVFGESPHQYLLTRRLERAAALLRTTDRSVAEICIDGRPAQRRLVHDELRHGLRAVADRVPRRLPARGGRARVPTCGMSVRTAGGRCCRRPRRRSAPFTRRPAVARLASACGRRPARTVHDAAPVAGGARRDPRDRLVTWLVL